MNRTLTLVSLVALGIAAALPLPSGVRAGPENSTVTADDAGSTAATAPPNNNAFEEITVTARGQEASLQSVPRSITALSAETLREQSISTTEELQQATPGVYLAGSGGTENVEYQIRGQSKALS